MPVRKKSQPRPVHNSRPQEDDQMIGNPAAVPDLEDLYRTAMRRRFDNR